MSFLELPAESSGPFQGTGPSGVKRPWIALAYTASVFLSCAMISFVMMNGSVFTTVLVVGLTLMPTVVLVGMIQVGRRQPEKPFPLAYASEGPSEEWESDDSIEVTDLRPEATESV